MRIALACLFLILAGCSRGASPTQSPSSVPAPPPAPSGIGPAGGTVSNGGAQVVVPAAALAQATQIAIAQTNAGAPALPPEVTLVGPMFAFTPHGTTFAVSATVTLPYDPSLVPAGAQVQLYKTNAAQTGWQSIPLTGTSANSVTAQVMSFSHLVVGTVPPAITREDPERTWVFEELLAGEQKFFPVEDDPDTRPNNQTGGVVEDRYEYGPLPLNLGGDHSATGEVFSNETGLTYWAYVQGPAGSILEPESRIGNRVTFVQRQGFKKNRADARLKLHVTKVFMHTVDSNGAATLYPECPTTPQCALTMTSRVTYEVKAFWVNTVFSGKSTLELSGYQAHWNASMKSELKYRQELWQGSDFVFDDDRFNTGAKQEASYELKEPVTIDIDLAKLDVGDKFTLLIEVNVETTNRRQRESYVSAFFRDPVSIEGATIETFGLDPIAVPYQDPPPDEPQAPECSSGDEAAAGTLQFAASTFFAPEMPTGTTQVLITRTGGTQGEVSATVRTQDDTAHAGTDYETVSTTVYFGHGQQEPRVLEVPLSLDAIAEPDKSLTVTLSDPRGCAKLGSPATATLTILDDDRPEPEPPPSGLDETFGTDGKATLQSFGGGDSDMALQADGKIVMVGGRFIDFVLARFNADGTPDTSFGTGGTVTTDIAGGFAQERARAVAIQPDGKIVVAGESSLPSGDLAIALVRYNLDGTLDTRFGSGGKLLDSGSPGRAFGVAIQSDGRIVVAGDTPVANNAQDFADFLVMRYNADGRRDATFAVNGRVVTDMTSRTDLARNIVVQSDGALVVSGDPFGSDPSRRTSVARYTASGVLDTSFAGGKLILAGAYVGRGLALQSDGRLILVGSMPVSNVPNDVTHFAVMRLNTDGTFDNSFGTEGVMTTSITGLTDVAHAVALQADGRIVVAGEGNLVNPNFALARYNTDGSLDTSFAVDGKLVVDFFGFEDRAENVAVQADGKVVAGGLVVRSTNGYGLVRVNP